MQWKELILILITQEFVIFTNLCAARSPKDEPIIGTNMKENDGWLNLTTYGYVHSTATAASTLDQTVAV
jgi:hypothetical protein